MTLAVHMVLADIRIGKLYNNNYFLRLKGLKDGFLYRIRVSNRHIDFAFRRLVYKTQYGVDRSC
jgi:hypothetical protein